MPFTFTGMIDFVLYETFSGGSKFFYNQVKDIQTTRSLFTYVYTLLFGGNVEAITKGSEQPREKRYDYWGNAAFYQNTPEKWFNSEFEKALNETELSSVGRIKLEEALKSDLKRLEKYGQLTATVRIVDTDFILAEIFLEDVGKFSLTWKANLEEEIIITDDGLGQVDPTPPPSVVTYEFSPSGDYEFSGDLEPYNFSQ